MTDPENPSDELARLRETWDRLGVTDPYWAILSDPAMRDGGWDEHLAAFLASGEQEVADLIERLRRLGMTPAGPALEFGCGVGRVTRALGAAVGEAHGVDIAASMLERARERADPGCEYHLNDATDLGVFGADRFGLVYSRLVFQHMPASLGEGFLAELLRVAAPGAPVVVQVPEARRGIRRIVGPAIQRLRRAGPYRGTRDGIEMHGIPRRRVEQIAHDAGADVVEVAADDSAGPEWVSWFYALRAHGLRKSLTPET